MKQDPTLNEKLNEVVEPFRMSGGRGLGSAYFTAFDTTKPNFHDSKAEFLEEKQLVQDGLNNADQLIRFLLSAVGHEDVRNDAAERICAIAADQSRLRLKDTPIRAASDLVRKNASEVGLPVTSAFVLLDLRAEFYNRLQELEDQEREYWSGSSRPPNHYARTIALRFARFIAGESGQRPTIGTSRDGDHPSTDYGRALEEVFQLLGIRANFKRAGMWAIDQLTDEDLQPPKNMLGGLFGFSPDGEGGRQSRGDSAPNKNTKGLKR
ncbi:hypothetical protein OO012_14870 [Rhodobacteraceae bacterium KMM 6894]|nr:hypothetical protein [Rhodobacteraceae bacterium KMM 6894]